MCHDAGPAGQSDTSTNKPRGNLAGFKSHFNDDFASGLLVFLIALPLCLGISAASGFPPIAGIFTAIIGSIVTPFLSNSELTIKGPAAGLIVIAIGCIEDFGGDGVLGGWDVADAAAYRAALAVGVTAAILQVLFGVLRGGILGEFFPLAAVHGMLAAIGLIIIIKQFPIALGVAAGGQPLEILREVPSYIRRANPAIAAIGLVSLAIMFVWPWLKKRVVGLRIVPAPLMVLVVAVPMGTAFDLTDDRSYWFAGRAYPLGQQFLVTMPGRVFGMFAEVTYPDFQALTARKAWKWVFMFFVIGSLESLLSAKAVDLLDPFKRKSDMNRDVAAVGTANVCASLVGGLPMISEIVRSRANIDNGAKTRFAGLWHGLFLLACVALIPAVLHRIPLAALAAMLIYTGFRLAHPAQLIHVYKIGREQLVIFCATIIAVLATDLLIGIAIGIVVKMIIHACNGVSIRSLLKTELEIQQLDKQTSKIITKSPAVFSNWIPFRRQIEAAGLVVRRNLIVDFSGSHLVDHSTMEKLEALQQDFADQGLELRLEGLESMRPLSDHPHATRKRM